MEHEGVFKRFCVIEKMPMGKYFLDFAFTDIKLDLEIDVETIFLFPWATIVRDLGYTGLYSILFFIVILGLGLAYAWKKNVLKWN